MKLRTLLTLVCVAALPLGLQPPLEASQSLSMAEAINNAGRQRMLTQRMLKAYCQMGQDIRYLKAKKQLREAVGLFESQLNELNGFTVNPEVSEGLQKVETLWKPVKAIVSEQPSRDKAEKLRGDAEKLLVAAHDVVLLMEAAAGTKQGRLVNTAGRQRMLSQRMASLYLLRSWGFDSLEYVNDYNQAIKEFSSGLSQLMMAPENTAELRAALSKVSLDWKMFNLSGELEDGKMVPSLVVRSLDKILVQMNDITGMYAKARSN